MGSLIVAGFAGLAVTGVVLWNRFLRAELREHEESRKDKGKGILETILTLSTCYPNYALTSGALLKRPSEDSTTYRL